MIWSFSAHASFRKCPRQWFYRSTYASSRAKDPLRREAHRLSKLEGIQAWRGKIVDSVISGTIIPSIVWKRPCSLASARRKAEELFTLQRAHRTADNGAGGFFEIEYGMPLTPQMFRDAHAEIITALENLYGAESLWVLLRRAGSLIAQRPLSFRHGTVSVRVVPDLIAFLTPQGPTVLDWKVNTYPMRDYWLQLVTGAIGVTRCAPHRDWPRGGAWSAHDVALLEVQLVTGDVRAHAVSELDVQEAEDLISISATEMTLACGGKGTKDLRPDDFPAASDPRTCQFCQFRKPCWGAAS